VGVSRTFVPMEQRKALVWSVHCLDHGGVKTAYDTLRDSHYWPDMLKDIKLWIQSCTCQPKQRKRPTSCVPAKGRTQPLQTALEEVSIDCYDYKDDSYLTILDGWSDFFECLHLRDKTVEEVNSVFEKFVANYGKPVTIRLDNGNEFNAINIHKLFTSAGHPQSNGKIERKHQELAKKCRIFNEMPDVACKRLNSIETRAKFWAGLTTAGREYVRRQLLSVHICLSYPKTLQSKLVAHYRGQKPIHILTTRQGKFILYCHPLMGAAVK